MPLARVEPRIDLPNPWGPVATPVLATIHRLLGLRTIERHLKTARSIRGASGPGHRFAQALSLRVEAEGPALRRIPRSGPLVVVCNHPLGGPDAIAAMALLERIRPDLRVIANRLLAALEGLGERSFLVDPFGGPDAARRNVAALRGALGHLEGGGAIVVFPAGEVAHRSWRDWSIVEPPWSATIARLVERSGAAVLPLFVHGRNRLRFHLAGLLHPRLRTLLLPREMLHWEGRTVRVAIGAPIPAARLTRCGSADATIEHLRSRTLLLGERPLEPTRLVDALAGPTGPNIPSTVLDPRSRMPERIRPARPTHHSDALPAVPTHPISPPQHLEREIARLDPACTLLEHHAWAVVLAPAAPIPRLLEEIGRLRELAFRSVGEGSGKALDLDRFDEHYRHLFLWDRERRRVLGAYRVGCTDEILASQGIDGLYTRTLFEFGPQLLERMGPSLELGRSFVRPELQRHPLALLMLWKGIGRLLVQQPRYRRMFGPVSISREFSTTSHRLMVEFLSATPPASEFASLIQPRRPPRFPPLAGVTSAQLRRVASSLEELDEIVAEIEGGRLGVPVLVRQYLKLNAQLLGFNVDPAFHDVIDALMCVDLLAVDRRILRQYLGAEGAEAYRRHHLEAAELPVG
jgi:putative hemolysin